MPVSEAEWFIQEWRDFKKEVKEEIRDLKNVIQLQSTVLQGHVTDDQNNFNELKRFQNSAVSLDAAKEKRRDRRQLWLTTLVVAAATILGAMVGAWIVSAPHVAQVARSGGS